MAGEVPYCLKTECDGAVKPDVVFFGQLLPDEFEEREKMVAEADLLIVMGTSLKVAPCSRLPRLLKHDVPRILINMEKVGDIGYRDKDLCIIGTCDDGVRELTDALGWSYELERLWNDAVSAKKGHKEFEGGPSLDECIAKIARTMKDKRKISDGHKRMLENHLNSKFADIMVRPPARP